MEVVHSLIPDRKLGARDVVASCPTVTLALNNDLLFGAAKIKGVQLFGWANTNFNEMAGMEMQALLRKEALGDQLKIPANVSI